MPSSSDSISFSKSLYGLTDWSSSLPNNTTDSIGTFNFWQPWRSSNCIFNSLSQTYWQAKSSPIKAPQALSQLMYKENSYLLDLFSVVCTNNMESNKGPLHCTNTERAKRKWKQGIKQRKDVYHGTVTSYFFGFCFSFYAKNKTQCLSLCRDYSPKPE